jgi:hypothetical protein
MVVETNMLQMRFINTFLMRFFFEVKIKYFEIFYNSILLLLIE